MGSPPSPSRAPIRTGMGGDELARGIEGNMQCSMPWDTEHAHRNDPIERGKIPHGIVATELVWLCPASHMVESCLSRHGLCTLKYDIMVRAML